ncbi:LysE family translocator [Corynebacterium sp. NPDC060344]|uniref:LysE family translocator n=1 Tax=Corynebacterium sp. NPDC060344 TaxID=3347101 RepID=UPI0036654187
MTVTSFAALIGVWFAAICSPGPDLLCLARIATRSRARGLAAAAGIVAGIVVWLVLTLAGLGALLAAAPPLLAALQIAGGAYLLWLGFSALRAGVRQLRSPSPHVLDDASLPSLRPLPGVRGAFLQGLFTNLSNPKAVIFFGAVFTRFITPGMGFAPQLLIVVVLAACAIAWFGCVAWGLGLRRFAEKLHRAGPWIDAVSGAVFVVLAIAVIAEGVTSL